MDSFRIFEMTLASSWLKIPLFTWNWQVVWMFLTLFDRKKHRNLTLKTYFLQLKAANFNDSYFKNIFFRWFDIQYLRYQISTADKGVNALNASHTWVFSQGQRSLRFRKLHNAIFQVPCWKSIWNFSFFL